MFDVLEDKSTIKPTYPCGKTGTLVDALRHGTTYATWKLTDDLERHVGTRTKPACQTCVDALYKTKEEASIDKFIDGLLVEARAAREAEEKALDDLLNYFN